MHSPNTIPNRLTSNYIIKLKTGFMYEMTYNRYKTILLPPPYQTNCKNYDLDDKHDYKLRSDCLNHCIYNELREECSLSSDKLREGSELMNNSTDCLFISDLLWRKESFIYNVNSMKPCPKSDQITDVPLSWKNEMVPLVSMLLWKRYRCHRFELSRVQSLCQDRCLSECTNRYYNYEIKKESPNLYQESVWKKVIFVRITHNHLPDQTNEHIPETTFVTFASNFGGLLGMWLGLSAVALFEQLLAI